MLTVEGELARLFALPADQHTSQDGNLSPHERRTLWIREQRLSPPEAALIPADFDPLYPYPREAKA